MLSVAKLTLGQEGYYERSVADGLDETTTPAGASRRGSGLEALGTAVEREAIERALG
jgi:hypothetical protein